MTSSMEDQPGQPNQQPGDGGITPPPSAPLRESVSSAGDRIQVIIEAAEKAAAGIIEDADAQARRYIDASRKRADVLADERVRVMSDLTETLIRQAELVKRQSDELLGALDSARGELASRVGQELPAADAQVPEPAAPLQEAAPAPAPRVPHLQPVESQPPDLQPVAEQPQPPPGAAQPSAPAGAAPAQGPFTAPAAQPPGVTPSDGARLLAAQMAVAGSSREEIEARLRGEFGIQDAGPILDGILGPG
jgi:hypothetical protein